MMPSKVLHSLVQFPGPAGVDRGGRGGDSPCKPARRGEGGVDDLDFRWLGIYDRKAAAPRARIIACLQRVIRSTLRTCLVACIPPP